MQRAMNPSLVLTVGACLLGLATVARPAAGQTFVLQGEGLVCDGSSCTVPDDQNLVVDGTVTFGGAVDVAGGLDVDGHAYLDLLTVQTSYWLPECPAGYARDAAVTEYILCEKVLAGGTDRMVKVGDFWIDKYELSAFPTAECTGTQYGVSNDNWTMPDTGAWMDETDDAYACSISGVTPSRFMTWFQAEQACAHAGKRLCSNVEWQAAAASTHDPGDTGTGTQCVVSGAAIRDTGGAGETPAATTTCVSFWGADDMVGNAWEWVEDWEAAGLGWQTGDGDSVCPSGCTQATGGWPSGYGSDATWNVNGRAFTGIGYMDGLPAAVRRGGHWDQGSWAGVFALNLNNGPSYAHSGYGARCCRR